MTDTQVASSDYITRRDAQIGRQYRAGHAVADIARHHGICDGAVRAILKRDGVYQAGAPRGPRTTLKAQGGRPVAATVLPGLREALDAAAAQMGTSRAEIIRQLLTAAVGQ